MALIDKFTATPEGRTTSNDGMNVGLGVRYNSDRLDSDRSTEGLAAFLAGRRTGRVDGHNDSYEAFDRLFPATEELSVGGSLPVGNGKVELSRDVRKMPDFNMTTNNNNINFTSKEGNYGGAYFGDDGYKGAYAGYQINPSTSVSGNINLDPTNKVSYALMQLRRTF